VESTLSRRITAWTTVVTARPELPVQVWCRGCLFFPIHIQLNLLTRLRKFVLSELNIAFITAGILSAAVEFKEVPICMNFCLGLELNVDDYTI